MISTTHFHPMLVHFPIAFVILGFIAEIVSLFLKKEICLTRLSLYLLLIGTLSALVALMAGVFFTTDMEGKAGQIQGTHELFAWITLITLLGASLLRILLEFKKGENSGLKWSALILYGIGAIAVMITGFYGGTLVYEYMMPI